MQALSEEIAEVAINDMNPKNWSAHGILPKDMTKEERGDAYWSRKMAVATIMVLTRVAALKNTISAGRAPEDDEEETSLDEEITKAETEAKQLLDEVQRQAKKSEFHKRIHG
jgi:uncharacterized protein YlxW (UPF0749 family)